MPDKGDDPPTPEGSDVDIIYEACKGSPTFKQRYDLSTWEVLGGGFFAVVVKLFAKPWAKDVAVKVLYKRHVSDPIRHKARQEALCAEAVGGEDIVRVYGPHETETLFWIEMEYVKGTNLKTELLNRDKTPLPYPRALAIARSVASAVARAHAAHPPVLHRDIKPANILLPSSGEPAAKLGDFGVSRIGDASQVSRSGPIPGTPLYSPPELRQGGPFTAASDVYCLGLVLFEVFTGRSALPLTGDMSEREVTRVHATVRPTPARTYVPDLPGELEDVLARAMAKKPQQRPTAAEISTVLEALARAQEAAAGARGSSRKVATLAAAGILVILLLGLAALLRTREPRSVVPIAPAAEPGPPQQRPTVAASPSPTEPVQAPLAATPAPAPSPSLRAVAGAPREAAPSPAARATPEPLHLTITYSGGVLDIVNDEKETLKDLKITLFDADGREFKAEVPLPLGPGEGTMVMREQFVPVLPLETRPTRARVVAVGTHGEARVLSSVLVNRS